MNEKDIKLFQNFYAKSTIEERFRMCMNKGDYHFTANDDAFLRDSYDYGILAELLKKSELEPYIDFLIQYQNKLYDYKETESEIHGKLRNIINDIKQEDKFTNLLIFLNDYKDTNWGLNIAFTNVYNTKIEIRDSKITKCFFEAVSNLYSELNMNRTRLTIEEAKNELMKPEFIDDLKELNLKCGFQHEDIDINNIPDAVLNDYAESISTEREINAEFFKTKRQELNVYMDQIKPKPGRKRENIDLGELALDLSYLIRFQRFVLQDDVEHIYDYEISNNDLKLIFNYLNFWDLKTLKRNVKNKDENSDRELKSGYINVSSWINSYKLKRGKKYCDVQPELNEIEIDKYRKIVREELF